MPAKSAAPVAVAPEKRKRVEDALKALDGFVMPFLFTDGGAHGWKIYDTDTVAK